jgi:hypothetical protein
VILIFGGFPEVPKVKPVLPKRSPDEMECRRKLKALKDDLKYYDANTKTNPDLITKTRKNIFLLILQKKENEWTLSLLERRFYRKCMESGEGEEWQYEKEMGPKSDNLNRAIDL